LVAGFLSVAAAQTCAVTLNGNAYDFSSLGGQTFSADMGMYTYVFTPCQNGCQGPSGTAAQICQDSGSTPIVPISKYDGSLQWTTSGAPLGVQFTTNNGGPPNCSPSNRPPFATIIFVCDKSGAQPQLTVTNEPNLQGCSQQPGYVFNLNTPLACVGYVPPPPPADCYSSADPCVIQTYNAYMWSGGMELIFNQGGDRCGTILFADYTNKPPVDTCVSNGTASHIVAHLDIAFYPAALEVLKAATTNNPVVMFWDPDASSAVVGPYESVSDDMLVQNQKTSSRATVGLHQKYKMHAAP